jgi:hypothetical protein
VLVFKTTFGISTKKQQKENKQTRLSKKKKTSMAFTTTKVAIHQQKTNVRADGPQTSTLEGPDTHDLIVLVTVARRSSYCSACPCLRIPTPQKSHYFPLRFEKAPLFRRLFSSS